MESRSRGNRFSFKSLLFFVLLGLLATGRTGGQPGREEADSLDMQEQAEPSPVFRVEGPNDGEPLNGRHVRFQLETSYTWGVAKVVGSSRVLHSLDLEEAMLDGAEFLPEAGVFRYHVDVEIAAIESLPKVDLSNPDTSFVRLKFELYDSTSPDPVASDQWRGALGFPWIEFLPELDELFDEHAVAELLDGEDADTALGLRLHPRAGDTFYFLLASDRREDLQRSPEETGVFFEVAVLNGGSLPPAGTVQFVDDPSSRFDHSPYLVLWTYHAERGWDRSQIYASP